MGLFSRKQGNINDIVAQWEADQEGILLDVRTPMEYGAGHIPGSENLPLDEMDAITQLHPDKQTRLLVYCLSGGRSGSAVSQLQRMGYQQAVNIGGISDYLGKLEV